MRRSQFIILVLLILTVAVYGFVEDKLHNELGPEIKDAENTILINPTILPVLAMGFDNAWADWSLFDAQIYYSDHKSENNLETGKLFKGMVGQVLALDPKRTEAARFAMFGLGDHWGLMGVADANELLFQAYRSNPTEYQLPYYIAMNHYLYGEKPEEVRTWISLALADKAAPRGWIWLADAAQREHGGDFATRASVICQFCQITEDKEQKKTFCDRCKYMQVALQLNEIRRQFEARIGRPIKNVEELLAAHELTALPPDPLKGRWTLDPDGQVDSSEALRLKKAKSTDVQVGAKPPKAEEKK